MATSEEIEKVRQGIMRYRELLDLLQDRLAGGERAYGRFFTGFSAEEIQATAEKDLQWRAAEAIVNDPEILRRMALQTGFELRDLGRQFEELHDNFVEED